VTQTKILEYFIVGKRFTYSKKFTMVEREEHHRVFEKTDSSVVLHITSYKERKEK
jgi:hypothetical protein